MQKKLMILVKRGAFAKQVAVGLVSAGHSIECAYSGDEALERLQRSLDKRRGACDAMVVTEEAVAEAGFETNSIELFARRAQEILGRPMPVIAMFSWVNGVSEYGPVTIMPGKADLLREVLLNVFSEKPS